MKEKERNIILFVGRLSPKSLAAIEDYEKKHKIKFQLACLFHNRDKVDPGVYEEVDIVIVCNMNIPTRIQDALLPYKEELLAITCHGDRRIPYFQKIIPNVPYLRTPTTESLEWSIDKIMMRKRFSIYDRKITPAFTIVHNATKASMKKIRDQVGFPLIVKPAGLAASAFVSISYHKEELEKTLRTIFRKIRKVYKDKGREEIEPRILVEQFMEGEMYSVDAYVTSRGRIYLCPFVHVKTGQSIGLDDFFGYIRITPTSLGKLDIEKGEEVAKKAVHALGLRNVTAHIELMKTNGGWKVVEVGPRMGGFRETMYRLSYDINHTMNDIFIRIPKKPVIPKKAKGHTAAMKFYAKKEGVLLSVNGVKKIQELKSVQSVRQLTKIGERCKFAKNGGIGVFAIVLFNKDRSKLLADIRRVEQTLVIKTER